MLSNAEENQRQYLYSYRDVGQCNLRKISLNRKASCVSVTTRAILDLLDYWNIRYRFSNCDILDNVAQAEK